MENTLTTTVSSTLSTTVNTLMNTTTPVAILPVVPLSTLITQIGEVVSGLIQFISSLVNKK